MNAGHLSLHYARWFWYDGIRDAKPPGYGCPMFHKFQLYPPSPYMNVVANYADGLCIGQHSSLLIGLGLHLGNGIDRSMMNSVLTDIETYTGHQFILQFAIDGSCSTYISTHPEMGGACCALRIMATHISMS